jgi:hypothetical protein
MAIAYKLIACSSLYPDIDNVDNALLAPYIGQVVTLGDTTKSYRVERYIQGAFLNRTGITNTETYKFEITSVIYNGNQLIGNTIPTQLLPLNSALPVHYPTFVTGQGCAFQIAGYNVQPFTGSPTFDFANIPNFIRNVLVTQLNLPILINQTHPDWVDLCGNLLDGSPQNFSTYPNFVVQKFEGDTLDFTFKVTYQNNLSDTWRFVFNGIHQLTYQNGTEVAMYSTANDRAVIANVNTQIPTPLPNCLPPVSFNTNSEINIANSLCCSCTSMTFKDTSVIPNSIPGHDVFGYRLIRLIRPDDSVFEYSSATSDTPDQLISVLTQNGVNTFTYQFTDPDIDVDGIWEVQIYNFPEWQNSVMYTSSLGAIVHKGDKLFKCIQTNTNVNPLTDTTHTYWAEYNLDEATLLTRYGHSEKKVVLCISLIDCYKSLIENYLCNADSCGSLCDNEGFMKAMRIRIIWDAINIAECNDDYDKISDLITMWKSICSCVNC